MLQRISSWFRKTTFGGTVQYSPGEVVSSHGMLNEKIKVQSYRRFSSDVPYIRLEVVAATVLSYQSHPIALRLDKARELVRLLEDAIQYFESEKTKNA